MKAKIILWLVVLNIALGAVFLFTNPLRLAAQNKETPVKKVDPSPKQDITETIFTPADKLEVLRLKEERLAAREAEIKDLERQVMQRIKHLEEIQAALRNDLAAYRMVSGDRIKHLVKIYSSMKPNAAATLMNNLDTDVAVEVFLGMKGDVAGGILSYMEPTKAALITQRLVSYRGTAASKATETASP